jgi:hypothetical protein
VVDPIDPLTGSLSVYFDSDGTMELAGRFTDAAAASRQLLAVVDPLMRTRNNQAGEQVEYDDATDLPRLRRLSSQAIRDAAAVGHRSYDDPHEGIGLYVTRDLEDRVLDDLTHTELVVVSGAAGAGKTSLLWGLAQRLVSDPTPSDVYFLKAAYLLAAAGTASAVTGAELADAIRFRSLETESVVLVDTADLLVGDEQTLAALMDLIDQVRRAGGRTVISARPDEALTITAGSDAPLTLGPFSTAGAAHDRESEFARAVRAHAAAYCSAPGDTGDLARAALLILDRPGGLPMLAARAVARPDDYFLSSVVEQAWILGWLRPDRMHEASSLALQHLDSSREDRVRRVLRVLAQVPVPDDVAQRMQALFPGLDLDLVKEYFRLLPRPGTPWQAGDSVLLTLVHSRDGDAARNAVIEVLLRLSFAAPVAALVATDYVAEASARSFLDDSSLDYAKLRTLLVVLGRHDGEWVLRLFERFGVGTSVATAGQALARVFSLLEGLHRGDAVAAARWADSVGATAAASPTLVHALGRLHLAAMRATDANRRPDDLVTTIRNDLSAIENNTPVPLTAAATAWAGIDLLTREADEDFVLDLLLELEGHANPRLHEQLHHGWFAPALNESDLVRTHFARVLADGLPASRRAPAGTAQRWADTVRRTLLRPEVEAPTLLAVLGAATQKLADRLPIESIWLDPDHLLWLLLAAANAGDPGAVPIVERLLNGEMAIHESNQRFAIQQAQYVTESGPGIQLVLRYLADRRGYVELLRLLEQLPDLALPESLGTKISSGLLQDAASGPVEVRARAVRLLLSATDHSAVPFPSWTDLPPLLTARHLPVRAPASTLIANGLLAGRYAPQAVVEHRPDGPRNRRPTAICDGTW